MKNNNNVAWKKHENKSPLRLGKGKWKFSIVRLLKCMWNDVISSVLAWLFEKSLDLSYITHDEGAGLGYKESPYSVCGSLTSALPWIVTTPKCINSSQVWHFESLGSFSDSSVYRYEYLLCWDDPAEAAALWPLGLQDRMDSSLICELMVLMAFLQISFLQPLVSGVCKPTVCAVPWSELGRETLARLTRGGTACRAVM